MSAKEVNGTICQYFYLIVQSTSVIVLQSLLDSLD